MPLIRYTQECLDAAEGKYPVGPDGKRPVSIRVQDNWLLENVFGRAHPITPIVWFGPFIAYGLHRSFLGAGLARTAGLYLCGWLIWSMMEYCLHRFLFHFNATTPGQRLQAFLLHGYHHAFPNDKTRLVAPPWMSWPPALIVAAIYFSLVPAPTAWALFAGTCTGYIGYDWIHYYTHHFKPSNPMGRWLRAYHLQHHHADEHSRYGVSSPLWDLVFSTFVPPVQVGRRTS